MQRIDVMCPGFTSDCLETLEEINMEVRHDFEASGGQEYHYIPCLNDSPAWITGLAEIAEQHLIGWPTMMTPAAARSGAARCRGRPRARAQPGRLAVTRHVRHGGRFAST